MSTCYERLNPTIITKLEEKLVNFPLTAQEIIDDLNSNVAITELKFNTILELMSFETTVSVNSVFNMFS